MTMTTLLIAVGIIAVVAVVVAATRDSGKKKCPACRQMIPKELMLCPHCQSQLGPKPPLKSGGNQ